MQTTELRARISRALVRAEEELHIRKLCRDGVESGFWRQLSSWLLAEERAVMEQVLEVDASEAEFRELRAGIKAFRRLRQMPIYSDAEYVKAEELVKVLRERLQSVDDLGVSEEVSNLHEQVRLSMQALARGRK